MALFLPCLRLSPVFPTLQLIILVGINLENKRTEKTLEIQGIRLNGQPHQETVVEMNED